MAEKEQHKKLTGKRVFIYFSLFFGVIFLMNFFMIKTAIQTNTGVVVEHAYEKEMKLKK